MDITISNKIMEITKVRKARKTTEIFRFGNRNVLTLRLLFHLPLRHTEGFIESLFHLMKVCLPILDHTTLFRRGNTLNPKLSRNQSSQKSLHLIVDSKGLSIHGEGPLATGKKRSV